MHASLKFSEWNFEIEIYGLVVCSISKCDLWVNDNKISPEENLSNKITKSCPDKIPKIWSQNLTKFKFTRYDQKISQNENLPNIVKTLTRFKFTRYDDKILPMSKFWDMITKSQQIKIY